MSPDSVGLQREMLENFTQNCSGRYHIQSLDARGISESRKGFDITSYFEDRNT